LFQNVLFAGTDSLGLFNLQRADSSIDNEASRALGRTYGLEVFLRRSLSERLGGFLSYTLSRSTRSVGHIAYSDVIRSAFRQHSITVPMASDHGSGAFDQPFRPFDQRFC